MTQRNRPAAPWPVPPGPLCNAPRLHRNGALNGRRARQLAGAPSQRPHARCPLGYARGGGGGKNGPKGFGLTSSGEAGRPAHCAQGGALRTGWRPMQFAALQHGGAPFPRGGPRPRAPGGVLACPAGARGGRSVWVWRSWAQTPMQMRLHRWPQAAQRDRRQLT